MLHPVKSDEILRQAPEAELSATKIHHQLPPKTFWNDNYASESEWNKFVEKGDMLIRALEGVGLLHI